MLPPPYNVDDDPIIPQYYGNVTIDSLNSSVNIQSESTPKTIPVIISENRDYVASNISSQRNCQAQPKPNIKTIKRSNKCLQALELPTVVNLNPRSVYNKISEFHTLVTELQVDLVCMSESWERESLTLDETIDLEDHQVISNVHQRTGMGGRPAIIVNNKKFDVQNLTNTLVSIPYGVEVTWALLTPKNISSTSVVKKIAVASIYSKPSSRKKTLLLDHIAETYHMLCSKYQSGLHFILAGDTNDLKLNSILSLSPSLRQVVTSPTRNGQILDPIITTLSGYYQSPICLPPLDNDPDKNGSPSDHMIVFMKPIDSINNNPARTKKTVTHRPLPESGIRNMGNWIVNYSWEAVLAAQTAHEKAAIFQTVLLEKLEEFLPSKIVKFTSEDQVYPRNKEYFWAKTKRIYQAQKVGKP